MENVIPRWLESAVEEALAVRRVVYLAGARHCGKTTLARRLPLPGADRKSLDEDLVLASAKADPAGFVVRAAAAPMVIDEVQKAKELLPAIKLAVDADRAQAWIKTGAQPTETVKSLLKKAGVL